MGSIRNMAVGLPTKDSHVLLSESFDQTRGLRFHRAVGGGIEFGETAVQALRREFREELDVALDEVRLLGRNRHRDVPAPSRGRGVPPRPALT